MRSLISAMGSVGLYCQHCGRLHVYDIPYFAGGINLKLECPHCGHQVAVIGYEKRTSILLNLPCSICGHVHSSVYQRRLLPRVYLNRIYCHHDNFELGYIGKRRRIEALLATSQAAFEELHPGEGNGMVERQRQMLETVNLLHDMASVGHLSCSCGCQNMLVDIQGSNVVLECSDCGQVAVINTADGDEIEALEGTRQLAFRKI